MKEAEQYRIKAFLWDQLVRPMYAIASASILKIFLLVFLFVAIIIKLHAIFVYITGAMLLVIFIYDICKYYKSGEFMYNYRKFKFPEYRKAVKSFKKEEKEETKSLNTLNSLNNHEETEESSTGE